MESKDRKSQKQTVVQQQLETWTSVRKLIQGRLLESGGLSSECILPLTQTLDMAIIAEGEALEHIDSAYREE